MGQALIIHRSLREVSLDGIMLNLTRIEFDLLACLMESGRAVTSTQALIDEVWGDAWATEGHHVEVHISRLRRKLGESADEPRFIHTVRGVGYRFEPDVDVEVEQVSKVTPDASAHLLVNTDGVIAWASSSITALLGWKADDLIGHAFTVLAPTSSFQEMQASHGAIAEVVMCHADGSLLGAFMVVQPITMLSVTHAFLLEVRSHVETKGGHPERTRPPIVITHTTQSVQLMYDRNLVLRALSPRDAPFLGWRPDDVVGTFFLLSTYPELFNDQARACTLSQSIVDAGIRDVHDHMLARSASGDAVPVHVRGSFLVDQAGRFNGLHLSVTPE